MPANAVSVTRPGKYGNPFTIRACMESGYAKTVEDAAKICVEAHSAWMRGKKHWAHGIPMEPPPDVSELRGKDVACFCAEDAPFCHGDTLLEIANA